MSASRQFSFSRVDAAEKIIRNLEVLFVTGQVGRFSFILARLLISSLCCLFPFRFCLSEKLYLDT
jgi:hypothetical protein